MKLLDHLPGENSRSYAARVILQNIITLELPPGSAVSENELSSVLKVSRTPVREALIELSKIGLVEIIPQKGSYVSKIDYSLIEETRFMRVVLENAVLKINCENLTSEYLEKLKANLDEERSCLSRNDAEKLLELDNEYHHLLFQAADKNRTYEILHSQTVHFDRLRALAVRTIKNDKTVEDHENILYAIERKDSELAEILMTRHLARHRMEKSELLTLYPDYFLN